MILSVPVAEVNTVVFSNGIFIARVDRLDLDLVKRLEQLRHDGRHFEEVAVWDESACLLPSGQFLFMVPDQFLVGLDKPFEEVDESGERVRTVLVLDVRDGHIVVFLRQMVLQNALYLHDHSCVLLAVPPILNMFVRQGNLIHVLSVKS